MARNLELKVRCACGKLDAVRERARRAQIGPFARVHQIDTYFAVGQGRLKVRQITPETGAPSAELIAYLRPDQTGPRWSTYRRIAVPAADAAVLRAALADTIGVAAVVAKTREVAISRRTRIHLDTVDGLGEFVELETVVDGPDDGDAAEELAKIADALGLDACATIAGSYADLIVQQRRGE